MKYIGHYMLHINNKCNLFSPNHTYIITFIVTNTNCWVQNSAYKDYVCNNYDKVTVTFTKYLVWNVIRGWKSPKMIKIKAMKTYTCSFTLNNDSQTFLNCRLFHESTYPTFYPSIHYALSSLNNNQNKRGRQHYMWWNINERTSHKLLLHVGRTRTVLPFEI